MSDEKRIGNQEPTRSFILPYHDSKGGEAIDLYNQEIVKTMYDWEAGILYDMMAVNDDGLWTHMKFGLSVPRQNGKTEIVIARIMWGLQHGEHILYTAHQANTSHAIYLRLSVDIDHVGLEKTSEFRAFGKEHIYLDTGGKVEFRTRGTTAGLGESFDCLIIDEAQMLTPSQEAALKYTLAAAKNPQMIMIGTPPTTDSAGTVFLHYRDDVLSGQGYESGWAEWGVTEMSDLKDEDLWYKTNPSLGLSLPVRNVRSEIGSGQDKQVDLNIQRLGLWLSYNLKSAISPKEWENLQVDSVPRLKGKLYVGIKFGQKEHSAAVAIAVRTEDGRVYVELIDDRPLKSGVDWIVDFLSKTKFDKVAVDGDSGRYVLEDALKQAKVKPPYSMRVADFVKANTEFEQALEKKIICHGEQAAVEQIISHCKKRAIGKTGWGYESQREGIDDALLDAMIIAYWILQETPEPTGKPYKQIIC